MFMAPRNKVEKFLKGGMDSIQSHSPSVKIQIECGKVFLMCKGKTLLGVVNKLLKQRKANFPALNLNFHSK
jgi:hypothetical protein